MNFNKIPNQKSEWDSIKDKPLTSKGVSSESVVVPLLGEEVKISKAKIDHVMKGLAEIAYSMGKTNDPDKYASEMIEDIIESFKKVEKKRKSKKNKN